MWEATFSADGRTLVSSQMEWVYVWDVESGTMRRTASRISSRRLDSSSCSCDVTLEGLVSLAMTVPESKNDARRAVKLRLA